MCTEPQEATVLVTRVPVTVLSRVPVAVLVTVLLKAVQKAVQESTARK